VVSVITHRLATVAVALDPSVDTRSRGWVNHAIIDALRTGGDAEKWLLLAVLRAKFPQPVEVADLRRAVVSDGPERALRSLVRRARWSGLRPGRRLAVSVAIGKDLVDVYHTSRTQLATGIQRVARMTLREWTEDHDIVAVGWTRDLSALRPLAQSERSHALYGNQPHAHQRTAGKVIIPWKSRYILLELAIEPNRVARIAALAEFSGNTCVAIGFDCVPLTTSETTGAGMGPAFARNLAALAHFEAVTTISEAAAREYGGWKRMLGSIGLPGPAVTAVLLPSEAGKPDPEQVEAARISLGGTEIPIVVCVGSHEPRKNHGAVVHAAELLWRKGLEFQLVFIGGNAWGDRSAYLEIEALIERGRPITMVSRPSDDEIWCTYMLATASIFPSFNEGFGLPVAESLAMGVPVVTSNYGSMAEIASQGGCILVDPRDDASIARGLERLLTDPAERERLSQEALARDNSSWAAYARGLWESFPNKP